MKEVRSSLLRMLPDLVVLATGLTTEVVILIWLWRRVAEKGKRALLLLGAVALALLLCFGFLLRFGRVAARFPRFVHDFGEGFVIMWVLIALPAVLLFIGSRVAARISERIWPEHSGRRRQFLSAAPGVALAAPMLALGYGVFVAREILTLREQRIVIPGLPAGLDGLKIVQLTDIHVGPFVSVKQVARAVAMANETRANLALVTGDLISSEGDPLDACLDELAALRADAGVFGCMGNHEEYARTKDETEQGGARRGIRFLRHKAQPLKFGGATLNLAGVDHQTSRAPYLRGAEKLVVPGAFNLLLSHNPDVFPVAAKQGYQLTISGHTHGGQVRVEILSQDLNIARFFTKYVDGLYTLPSSSIFVSRGIGTIGVPARLGSPPEVALITLARG